MLTGGNPLRQLQQLGQSVWLDDLSDRLLRRGELARLIAEDGISGVTSNPTILQKAIAEDPVCVDEIRRQDTAGATEAQIAENLTVALARKAADELRRVHGNAGGNDGFVSLEVPPALADDTPGTVAAARRLWQALARPNAMIKVPATPAGLPAIRQLLADGINVNITLIFGVARYREVLHAFAAGLEERRSAGRPLEDVASVASVFVSRIDTLVDQRLTAAGGSTAPGVPALLGRAGTAVARFVYQDFRKFSASAEWKRLAAYGARPQRPLWASTSTKNPAYRDVLYVETLVGPDTINTMPQATIQAFREHGQVARTIDHDLGSAHNLMESLKAVGIDYHAVTTQLETEGIDGFSKSYQALLADIEKKSSQLSVTSTH